MKVIKPLSDLDCKRLKPAEGVKTPARIRDGGGLYLEALANGRRVWRFDYVRPSGKRTRATFGDYPDVTLAKAREERTRCRSLLSKGIDPNTHAEREKLALKAAHLATFEAAADEFLEHHKGRWSPAQQKKVSGIIRRVLLPWLGKRPVADITAPEVLDCLQRYERQGKLETAHAARSIASRIFRRSIVLGTAHTDPAQMLLGALTPKSSKNYAHIVDPAEFASLLRAIDGYSGSFVVACALRLAPMLAQRPGELRQMKWEEVDVNQALWTIPEERMKMRRPHVVPLPVQALAVLEEIRPLTGHREWVFPGHGNVRKPISENTLPVALKKLGYPGHVMTAHGFRHSVSTMLNESGRFHADVIERQLAHQDKNVIRGTYNKAEYLDERRVMMQTWADYLEAIKLSGAEMALKDWLVAPRETKVVSIVR